MTRSSCGGPSRRGGIGQRRDRSPEATDVTLLGKRRRLGSTASRRAAPSPRRVFSQARSNSLIDSRRAGLGIDLLLGLTLLAFDRLFPLARLLLRPRPLALDAFGLHVEFCVRLPTGLLGLDFELECPAQLSDLGLLDPPLLYQGGVAQERSGQLLGGRLETSNSMLGGPAAFSAAVFRFDRRSERRRPFEGGP